MRSNSKYIPRTGKRFQQGHEERIPNQVSIRQHPKLDPETWKRPIQCHKCFIQFEARLSNLKKFFAQDFGEQHVTPQVMFAAECPECATLNLVRQNKIPNPVKERVR